MSLLILERKRSQKLLDYPLAELFYGRSEPWGWKSEIKNTLPSWSSNRTPTREDATAYIYWISLSHGQHVSESKMKALKTFLVPMGQKCCMGWCWRWAWEHDSRSQWGRGGFEQNIFFDKAPVGGSWSRWSDPLCRPSTSFARPVRWLAQSVDPISGISGAGFFQFKGWAKRGKDLLLTTKKPF